ncbi:MAG: CBS domain-containing protein [Dehalococcoidia bacterium]
MRIKDIMTWNVVTVSSDTPIMEARKVMDAHKIRRMPVVDKGKLVGMISRDGITRASPSPATSLSVWEINYLLAKMTVKDIMSKKLVTVTPDTTVESAVALAQNKGVGALPVVEDGTLVGIVTTDDFFYKILNPVLGIGKPGTRLLIGNCGSPKCIQEIMEVVDKNGIKIIGVHNMPPTDGEATELVLHLDNTDPTKITKELMAKGYTVEVRER